MWNFFGFHDWLLEPWFSLNAEKNVTLCVFVALIRLDLLTVKLFMNSINYWVQGQSMKCTTSSTLKWSSRIWLHASCPQMVSLACLTTLAPLGTAGYSQIPTRRAHHDFHSPPTFVNPLHYTYISRRLLSSILPLDYRAIVCFNTLLIVWLFPQDHYSIDINSSQGWFAHECLVPDTELSLIDEQGKDTVGKLVLTLISVVSHCLALQRVS